MEPSELMIPLSPEQLFALKRGRDERNSNITVSARLFGRLDTAALAAAARDVVCRHEILFDSRLVDPLIRDLFAFYSARIENRKPDLPPLSMQYADYARVDSPVNNIDGKTPATAGDAVDGNDAASSNNEDCGNKGTAPMRINPALHGGLLTLAKEAGVSIDSIIHAGFAAFLSRSGFGDTAVFSTLLSARDSMPGLMQLVGNFETVLPLKISTQSNPTFREVVKRAAKAEPPRRAAGIDKAAALPPNHFRTLFRIKPAGIETLELPLLKVFVNPVPAMETGFELIFDLSERLSPDGKPEGIEGSVIFKGNAFPARNIAKKLGGMITLLKHGVLNPDTCIGRLPIEEKQTAWARTALAADCRATAPERVPMARAAMVRNNGRQEKVSLSDVSITSAATAATAAPEWQQGYVAFQDALQCRLAVIWEEVLNISRVGVRDRFVDLGGDAGKARRILGRVF